MRHSLHAVFEISLRFASLQKMLPDRSQRLTCSISQQWKELLGDQLNHTHAWFG